MVMSIYNKLSVLVIAISLFLFLSAYYYHQQAERHSLQYSKAFAAVTSKFFLAPTDSEPQMSSKGYVFTEERGILFVMILSVFLCVISVVLNYIGYMRSGSTQFHLPLNFASVILAVWICVTVFQVGLNTYF